MTQMVSFKVTGDIPLKKFPLAINTLLPESIRVKKAVEKPLDYLPRFSVKQKTYEYLIFNGQIVPINLRNYVWQIKTPLDLKLMRKGATVLIGRHDFSSFCAAGGDDNNYVRKILSIKLNKKTVSLWAGQKTEVVSIKVCGTGFLYKMVRNMVGALVAVGQGKTTVDQLKMILKAKNRRIAPPTAPAKGLCLVKVKF